MDSAGNLYACGTFTTAGDVAANHVAKWNGSTWSALGTGIEGESASVRALALDGAGNLYVGGSFTIAGGVGVNNIAKWDGGTWSVLGTGIEGTYYYKVMALAVDGAGNLYAGGEFSTAGGAAAKNVAKWDGYTWAALGSGIDDRIDALAWDGAGNLYAGGLWTLTQWDGSAWSELCCAFPWDVTALAAAGSGTLFVGGAFDEISGVAVNHVAKWDAGAWSSLGAGQGMNSLPVGPRGIRALAMDSVGVLYASGDFTTAGGVVANYIARWDGNAWSPLGSGTGGLYPAAVALAVDVGGNLYVGGPLTEAGGEPVDFIAKWNGSAWLEPGGGTNGELSAMAVDSAGILYAAGGFTTAGSVAAKRIAKWDGTTWSPLGSGINDEGYPTPWIYALATDNVGNLYAGGEFHMAGGMAVNHIAKWNGSAWSSLGSGLDGSVYALAVDGAGNLYAGGWFYNAGGVPANHVAKWNGSAWSALGEGMGGDNPYVRALAVDGAGNLYAGGEFATAGGAAAQNIAKWDGSTWSALGSGANRSVRALAVDGAGNLFAGGHFTSTGGIPAAYIGSWESVNRFTLTIAKNGAGRVISNPAAINCGTACSAPFMPNTVVTLAAQADPDFTFTGWIGACTGAGACQVTMDAAKIVTATFTPNYYALTVGKVADGSGRVTSTPAGIDCGGVCKAPFVPGTVVTLSAVADAGSTFGGWSGGCSGTGTCQVTMNAAKTVTAMFEQLPVPLNITKAGSGIGMVTSSPPGIACGGDCEEAYPAGSVVTLTAAPGQYSVFDGWSGGCSGTGACQVTMNAATTVTATFTLQTFPLTVAKNGNGTGAVTSSPLGIDCGTVCSAAFPAGQAVTLAATADAGMTFSGWSGACSGMGACQVTMDAAKQVAATFEIEGAVTPQGSMMYYGPQLEVKQGTAAAAVEPATTKLVVFAGALPPGLFLVGVAGSEPYVDEVATFRLINRLLRSGCGGSACSAVDCSYYAADGTHRDVVVTSFVMTDHLYLPEVSRR